MIVIEFGKVMTLFAMKALLVLLVTFRRGGGVGKKAPLKPNLNF